MKLNIFYLKSFFLKNANCYCEFVFHLVTVDEPVSEEHQEIPVGEIFHVDIQQ